jgi:hypothetical protein
VDTFMRDHSARIPIRALAVAATDNARRAPERAAGIARDRGHDRCEPDASHNAVVVPYSGVFRVTHARSKWYISERFCRVVKMGLFVEIAERKTKGERERPPSGLGRGFLAAARAGALGLAGREVCTPVFFRAAKTAKRSDMR